MAHCNVKVLMLAIGLGMFFSVWGILLKFYGVSNSLLFIYHLIGCFIKDVDFVLCSCPKLTSSAERGICCK